MSIINLLKKYLLKNKIKNEDANKYLNIFLTGMLFEFNHHNFDLNKSIKSLQTRGGINEDLLKRLQKDKFFKKIEINLNKIFLIFESRVLAPKFCQRPKLIKGNFTPLSPHVLYNIFEYLFLDAEYFIKKILN